jgi:hypothetical protein
MSPPLRTRVRLPKPPSRARATIEQPSQVDSSPPETALPFLPKEDIAIFIPKIQHIR